MKKPAIKDRFSVAERKVGTYGDKIGGVCKSPAGGNPGQGQHFWFTVVFSLEVTLKKGVKIFDYFSGNYASNFLKITFNERGSFLYYIK